MVVEDGNDLVKHDGNNVGHRSVGRSRVRNVVLEVCQEATLVHELQGTDTLLKSGRTNQTASRLQVLSHRDGWRVLSQVRESR